MKIGDAVREPLAQKEVERHQEVQEERWAAGEENLIGGAQGLPHPPEQPEIRAQCPPGPAAEVGAVVGRSLDPADRQRAAAQRLLLDGVGRRGQAREHDLLTSAGALASELETVLADGAEVWGEPVAEVEKAVRA